MSTPTNVLHWSGTKLDNAQNLGAQLQATADSGFSTILLWSCNGTKASIQDYATAITKALQ